MAKTITNTATKTIPDSIEAHESWLTHHTQRQALHHALTSAQNELAKLIEEREQSQKRWHEATVQQLLGATTQPDPATLERVHRLDRHIADATAQVNATQEAIRRHDAREVDVRQAITIEMAKAIQDAAPAAIQRLAAALADAAAANLELQRLWAFGLVTLPVPSWQELSLVDGSKLSSWLAQARAAGLDV